VARVGPVVRAIGTLGAWFIYALIWLFGRARRRADVDWLVGPIGGNTIGDRVFADTAEREGLVLDDSAADAGLVPDFADLSSDRFDATRAHPLVREFYEHTTRFAMDVWSKTYFPSNLVLWLLVKTISKQVDQLNFPLSPLDTARGMTSEIILLRRPDRSVRYAGWLRRIAAGRDVLYAGFYLTARAPNEDRPCVKAVFPMPDGSATVLLRPDIDSTGALLLDSSGKRFGDVGFYRMQRRGSEHLQVWYIRTLHERFRIYVDDAGTLRGDHDVRFLGLPVLSLHYKMFRAPEAPAARKDEGRSDSSSLRP